MKMGNLLNNLKKKFIEIYGLGLIIEKVKKIKKNSNINKIKKYFKNIIQNMKKLKNSHTLKLFFKVPFRLRTIISMILLIILLYSVSQVAINSNFSLLRFGKKYDNKLSFVEVNTNPKTNINSATAKVSFVSSPSWYFPAEGGNCYISQYYHWGHRAIDIAGCGYGSNIHAAHTGTVVTAGWKNTNGNYIVIRHDNGYHTMYAHLSQIYVQQNARVNKGDVIGATGSTGNSTGPHLHFSVWENGYPYYGGTPVNPFNFY